ncbi:hypothetical protein [Modicisalibacter sp. 'Wilcox']|uniref:hypothetical protein n=1 Tax=Modicisalibacter sp. 'Wilcox' TaxID=2679914 RepID=UPI0013D30FC7|nr:hypothetical protein [Modicisalibacter sp. 'Wilcox']
MSSRQGKRNVKPTKREVAGYYALLKSAAESGDTDAARHLIDLFNQDHHRKETAQ